MDVKAAEAEGDRSRLAPVTGTAPGDCSANSCGGSDPANGSVTTVVAVAMVEDGTRDREDRSRLASVTGTITGDCSANSCGDSGLSTSLCFGVVPPDRCDIRGPADFDREDRSVV